MNEFQRPPTERVLFRAFVAKVFNMIVTVGYNILLVPILLTLWGVEKFGVWIAVMSVFSLLMALDIGHSTYIGNEFNKNFNKHLDKSRFILASGLKAQYISGFIQIVILYLCVTAGWIQELFEDTIHLESALLGLGVLLLYRFIVGSARGILIRVVYPIGLMDRMTYLYTIEKCLEIAVMVIIAVLDSSIAMAALCVVLVRVFYSLYIFRKIKVWMPAIFPWWEKGSWAEGVKNYLRGLSLALSTFVDKFNADGINIVISAVMGALILPVFATIRTLGNTAIQGVQLIAEPLQPELTRYHVAREFFKLKETLKTNWLINGLVVSVGFSASVYIVEPLYAIWTNEKLVFNSELYLLIISSVLMITFGRPLMVYLRSINALRELVAISIVRVTTVLGLAVLLIYEWGLIGVGIAIVIGELVSSCVLPTVFVRRILRTRGTRLEWQTITISSAPYFLATLFVWMQMYLDITTWLLPIFISVLFGIIGYLQWVILASEVKRKLRGLIHI